MFNTFECDVESRTSNEYFRSFPKTLPSSSSSNLCAEHLSLLSNGIEISHRYPRQSIIGGKIDCFHFSKSARLCNNWMARETFSHLIRVLLYVAASMRRLSSFPFRKVFFSFSLSCRSSRARSVVSLRLAALSSRLAKRKSTMSQWNTAIANK